MLKPAMLAVMVAGCACAVSALSAPIPTKLIGVDVQGRSVEMPMAGLGTWLLNSSETEEAVATALRLGGRLVDTANVYGTQASVAKGIARSGVNSDELFLSTKVPGGLGTAGTIAAHEQNLQLLGVESVDLLLVHLPCGFPTSPTGAPVNCSKAARQATWRGLEALYRSGKARAIGVSHYCQKHLEDILEINTVNISVNQQEWHVGMGPDPEGVVSFCRQHGISYQSFSPLCGPCGPAAHGELVKGKMVSAIAQAHNVTASQVSLRWLVEQGSPVIAKSVHAEHLESNLDLFGFSLTAAERTQLDEATSPPSAEPVSGDCQLNAPAPKPLVV